jgi:hypothetical protein
MTVVTLLLALVMIAALSPSSRVGPTGVGPIVFGTTPTQAESTGTVLTPLGTPAEGSSCYYLRAKSLSGLDFMVEGGTLRRVDVNTPDFQTTDGFRVGDSATKVERFYGPRASIEPDKYDSKAQTITVAPLGSDAAKYRIVFKVKGGEVGNRHPLRPQRLHSTGDGFNNS